MTVAKCKGMCDLSSEEMRKFRFLEDIFRSVCHAAGYEEVRTPTIEYLHLFTSAGTLTPQMLNKVYSFLDWDGWSGERVVLRPDGTIPVTRFVLDKLDRGEIEKLFYVENFFRFEEEGRRELWQFGAELIGSSSPAADLELLLICHQVLTQAGLKDVKAKLSHAGIMKALLKKLAAKSGLDQRSVWSGDFRRLVDASEIANSEFRDLVELFTLTGTSSGFVENIAALVDHLPPLKENLESLLQVTRLLDGVKLAYEIDFSLPLNFEYYTDLVFKIYAADTIVGSGGRYDDLCLLLGGPRIPSCGFALYVEDVTPLLDIAEVDNAILVRVVDALDSATAGCLEVVEELRQAGYVVELDLGRRNLGKFRWVLSYGVEGNGISVVIRDSKGETERKLAAAESLAPQIINFLRERA